MNYLRNFFYNTSDIIIAAVIVVISAIVIWTRIDAIMSYPGAVPEANKSTSTVEEPAEPGAGDATVDEADADAEATTPPDDAATTPADGTGEATDPTDPSAATGAVGDGSEVEFKVEGGQGSGTIAENLVNAGLVADRTAFLAAVKAAGADTKLRSGTFTIKKGLSYDEVIAILTKSG